MFWHPTTPLVAPPYCSFFFKGTELGWPCGLQEFTRRRFRSHPFVIDNIWQHLNFYCLHKVRVLVRRKRPKNCCCNFFFWPTWWYPSHFAIQWRGLVDSARSNCAESFRNRRNGTAKYSSGVSATISLWISKDFGFSGLSRTTAGGRVDKRARHTKIREPAARAAIDSSSVGQTATHYTPLTRRPRRVCGTIAVRFVLPFERR